MISRTLTDQKTCYFQAIVVACLIIFQLGQLQSQSVYHYLPGEKLFVFAPSGLNVRSGYGQSAKIVGKVRYGDTLTVLKTGGEMSHIENRLGIWTEIRTSSGLKGFVFSGYTSRNPVPHYPVDKPIDLIEEYLSYLFIDYIRSAVLDSCVLLAKKTEVLTLDSDPDKGMGAYIHEIFSDGTVITLLNTYENVDCVIYNNAVSLNDILNYFDYLAVCISRQLGTSKRPVLSFKNSGYGFFNFSGMTYSYPFTIEIDKGGRYIAFNVLEV